MRCMESFWNYLNLTHYNLGARGRTRIVNEAMQRVCPFDIKKALLLMSAFFVLSSVVSCLYARDMLGVDTHEPSGYSLFWGGRFLAGIACGLGMCCIISWFSCLSASFTFSWDRSTSATAVVPTYLAEISPKRIRGAVGTSNQLQLCLGIIVANVLGYGTNPIPSASSFVLYMIE